MQRRKVDTSNNGHGSEPTTPAGPTYQKKTQRTPHANQRGNPNPNRILTILLLATFLLALGSFLFPNELRQVEDTTAQTTKDLVSNAYRAEQNLEDWFVHQHPQFGGSLQNDQDSTAAMARHQSSWVDGEKRLKEQLKVLAERQKKGVDVGVPVLTRYLGEDFPAWAGKDIDQTSWQKKVDAKYAEMAKEEEKWRESVRVAMERRAREVQEKAENAASRTTV